MGLKPAPRAPIAPPWLEGRLGAENEKWTGRNELLTIILRPKREKIRVTGCWRKCHGEEIHNLCLSWNHTGMNKWKRTRARYEMHRKVFFFENLKRKRSFGRHRRRWEGNNKYIVYETNTMEEWEPYLCDSRYQWRTFKTWQWIFQFRKCQEFLSFTKRILLHGGNLNQLSR
jgi:hypothetical protein